MVVQKNPIKTNYERGEFISVNLDEAIKRLRNVVGEKISDTEYKSFKKISAHRNKVIHFYHNEIGTEKGLQTIISEQCEAWYHIRTLFTKKWRNLFGNYIDIFEKLDWRMKQHWEYLSTLFKKKKPEIEQLQKQGEYIGQCSYCSFESVHYNLHYPEIKNGHCLVCNRINTVVHLKCECGNSMTFQNEGWGECTSCGKIYEPEDVYNLISDLGYDNSEWPDNLTPANCQFCDGYHTVAALHDFYICTSCFEISDSLSECEWCNENCIGDTENSYWTGCGVCEGKIGWEND